MRSDLISTGAKRWIVDSAGSPPPHGIPESSRPADGIAALDQIFAAIEAEAAKLGASVRSSEIIGFIPLQAFTMAPAFFRRAANFSESRIVETRIGQLLHSK